MPSSPPSKSPRAARPAEARCWWRPPACRAEIAVLAENAFDYDTELGADGLLDGPVDGDVPADGLDQFAGDRLEGVVAEDLDGVVVGFEGVVEESSTELSLSLSPRRPASRISLASSISF